MSGIGGIGMGTNIGSGRLPGTLYVAICNVNEPLDSREKPTKHLLGLCLRITYVL